MNERWRQGLRVLDTLEPSPDVWDRAVVRSAGVPPTNVRADGQRRILAGTVAALVAAAGLAVVFLAFRSLGTAPELAGINTYRDPTRAWEIAYPDRFRLGRVPNPRAIHHRVTFDGIWIANFEPPPPPDDADGPLYFEVPDTGVVVIVYQVFGGPFNNIPRERDSSFPIAFEELKAMLGIYAGVWVTDTVIANGEAYTIMVRMGPNASADDQQAAEQIVSSFRILPLEEGAVTGKHPRFFVLGPPDRYPMGSVTRFGASSLPQEELSDRVPFYLVHVPDGFYALAWPADLVGGYQDCDITYEPDSREFTCPNGARWVLDGSVIAKPDPELPGDPLRVLLVRISLDGHVLVSPNVFMSETELDLKLT